MINAITHPSDVVGALAFLAGLALLCAGIIAHAWADLAAQARHLTARWRGAGHIGATVAFSNELKALPAEPVDEQLQTVAEKVADIVRGMDDDTENLLDQLQAEMRDSWDRAILAICPGDEFAELRAYLAGVVVHKAAGFEPDDTGSFDRAELDALLAGAGVSR